MTPDLFPASAANAAAIEQASRKAMSAAMRHVHASIRLYKQRRKSSGNVVLLGDTPAMRAKHAREYEQQCRRVEQGIADIKKYMQQEAAP